jgi:hypothetical protein
MVHHFVLHFEQTKAEMEASFDEKERSQIAQSRSVSFLSPIAFAWGQPGTSDLQETFVSEFKALDSDLSCYSVICDQGPA